MEAGKAAHTMHMQWAPYLLGVLGCVCAVDTVEARGNSGNPEQELQQQLSS